MEAYMQRVIDERADLIVKSERLTKFIVSPAYTALSGEDRFLLRLQDAIMDLYGGILDRRISICDSAATEKDKPEKQTEFACADFEETLDRVYQDFCVARDYIKCGFWTERDAFKTKVRGLVKALSQRGQEHSETAPKSGIQAVDAFNSLRKEGTTLQPGTAPKITPADIEANIASEVYFTARNGVSGAVAAFQFKQVCNVPTDYAELFLLTFCVLTLKNGFTVTGESACVSPENFDADVGRKLARKQAVDKVGALMGYALKSRLAMDEKLKANHAVWGVYTP